jgi:hypothetical protein
MDDVVAIRVRDSTRRSHYFITWGRIFGRTDPKPLETVIKRCAGKFGIRNVKSVAVCDSLAEASSSRYFFEVLFHIGQERVPFGIRTYESWRRKKQRQMITGKSIFFCGLPKKDA